MFNEALIKLNDALIFSAAARLAGSVDAGVKLIEDAVVQRMSRNIAGLQSKACELAIAQCRFLSS